MTAMTNSRHLQVSEPAARALRHSACAIWWSAAVVVGAAAIGGCKEESASGKSPLMANDAGGATGAEGAAPDALLERGKGVYTANCVVCHQADGKGTAGTFPPLVGNAHVKDKALVIKTLLQGHSGPLVVNGQKFNGNMPTWSQLSDDDLAAVATYVRNGLNQNIGSVAPAEVKALR
jgi:cytochrome c oxidase subunit II